MNEQNFDCKVNVTSLAICQKCPRLFFYTIFMYKKTWDIGIKGSGYYGSIFHKEIASKFFQAAYDYNNPLHKKIVSAIEKGYESFSEFVKTEIFYDFLKSKGKNFYSNQILALAYGTEIWLREMWEFLSEIPVLLKFTYEYMIEVFKKPEEFLNGFFTCKIQNVNVNLNITGRYDALLFNPDKHQARLFEFKGYNKSDVTVPLSQSLIYAWLIEKQSGIFPEIEIIHLSESESPSDKFTSQDVHKMIDSAIPKLFETACKVFLMKEVPEPAHDKNLCKVCKYKNICENEIRNFILNHKK